MTLSRWEANQVSGYLQSVALDLKTGYRETNPSCLSEIWTREHSFTSPEPKTRLPLFSDMK